MVLKRDLVSGPSGRHREWALRYLVGGLREGDLTIGVLGGLLGEPSGDLVFRALGGSGGWPSEATGWCAFMRDLVGGCSGGTSWVGLNVCPMSCFHHIILYAIK